MKLARGPAMLVTRGLGSCLGIVLYEPHKKIGALGHAMLPKIDEGRVKSNPYKFVDSSIASMSNELKKQGCQLALIKTKLFGGGHMFSSIPANSVFNIGMRNYEVAKETLSLLGIKVVSEDVGGKNGRTLFFNVASGEVLVKTLFHGEKIL